MVTIQESHSHPDYPRLSVQLRVRSRFYQAVTFLDGAKVQKSLKTDNLTTAFKLAEEWYRKLLRASVSEANRHPIDRLGTDPTMAELFASYRTTLVPSKRDYADMKWSTIQHFWRTLKVTDINAKTFREFYTWRRRRKTRTKTTIRNHSLHKDVMVVRQVLKYAIEEEHISGFPRFPASAELRRTRARGSHAMNSKTSSASALTASARLKATPNCSRQRKDLEDFILIMMESLMRVSELRGLTVGQCTTVKEKGKTQYVLMTCAARPAIAS